MEKSKLSNSLKFKILVILAIAITLSLGFYMYEETNIILHSDQKVENIISRASTVEEFLQEQNITLNKEGYINISLDKELEDNMHIIIKNPKTYTISLAGEEWDVKSTYTTVEEILTDSGVNLSEKDYAIPDLKSKVYPGHKISVFHVKEVVDVVEEKIPFENITKKNPNLDIGTTKVIQEGKEGIKEITSKTKFINDQLIKEEVIEEKVTLEPIDKVVEEGSRKKVVEKDSIKKVVAKDSRKKALPSRGDISYRKELTMSATAYDLSFESCGKRPGDRGYGITASGTKAGPGSVAVDPRVIPLGTKLYIESLDGSKDYGYAVAEDTGGAIKGNKIDLFFHSKSEVRSFGRRKVKVYVLK